MSRIGAGGEDRGLEKGGGVARGVESINLFIYRALFIHKKDAAQNALQLK